MLMLSDWCVEESKRHLDGLSTLAIGHMVREMTEDADEQDSDAGSCDYDDGEPRFWLESRNFSIYSHFFNQPVWNSNEKYQNSVIIVVNCEAANQQNGSVIYRY